MTIADLDIVNPYFRSKDSTDVLEAEGVRVIALPFANSSVDLPALPSAAYAVVQDRTRYAVLDIGGDDRGAYALGRFVPYLLEENDYEMLYVVNFQRPLTTTVSDAVEVMREIERVVLLRNVDQKWMDHIDAMDELKRGIYLRSMGQRDPVVEYRFEGFAMFDEMIASIREDTARAILTVRLRDNRQAPQRVQVMRPAMPQGTVRKAPKKDK